MDRSPESETKTASPEASIWESRVWLNGDAVCLVVAFPLAALHLLQHFAMKQLTANGDGLFSPQTLALPYKLPINPYTNSRPTPPLSRARVMSPTYRSMRHCTVTVLSYRALGRAPSPQTLRQGSGHGRGHLSGFFFWPAGPTLGWLKVVAWSRGMGMVWHGMGMG
ncbi:hypothetical protein S40285_09838 [Stachybotrys chlorohalonatus IBT 40285]|uniref:Uncharacterized protein n=1 Tax=Stachybotrys chlorohalonatus (strain IBT 40285) TaxID=1283841 RepID=A0A084QU72_STAC4|nr:hypothetical protein S40285_09838 [Stachybotrys chlorohalonata IBT 40285]